MPLELQVAPRGADGGEFARIRDISPPEGCCVRVASPFEKDMRRKRFADEVLAALRMNAVANGTAAFHRPSQGTQRMG